MAYQNCCVTAEITEAAMVVVMVTALAIPKPIPAGIAEDEVCPATLMPNCFTVIDCGALW